VTELLSLEDHAFIERAARVLEKPSALVRAADLLGKPIELGLALLPLRFREGLSNTTRRALEAALTVAVSSLHHELPAERPVPERDRLARWTRRRHVLAAAGTGGVGGALGWAGLAAELPVSTTLMLRSVAAIARDFGEDLNDPAVRLECLTIFAHGGRSRGDEEMDASYLALRAGLADWVQRSASFVAAHGAREVQEAIAKGSAPALVQLLGRIGARFDFVVTEKLVASGVPVVGALGGAAVTAGFTDYFNSVARAHFGLRGLERRHGQELVEQTYRRAAGLPGDHPELHVVLASETVETGEASPPRRDPVT